jgi:hypothetical protein
MHTPNCLTRRSMLRLAAAPFFAETTVRLMAASDFWNKKDPSAWSSQEITQLTSRSPWSKEINAEFELDSDYTPNGADGPSIGRGGQIGAPGTGSGAPPQVEIGKDRNGNNRGSRRREPVIVRWESAQPMRDAMGTPLPAGFDGRYVLSVSGLPLGVLDRRRRGTGGTELSSDPEENTPVARQRRMVEQLQLSATLEARGRAPEQPGVVKPMPRTPGTYLFGFSRELLPLASVDREVLFTLRTGLMSVKAKFDPKEMLYKGKLAL